MKPLYGSGFPNHDGLLLSPIGWGRFTPPAFLLICAEPYAKSLECSLIRVGLRFKA